MSEPINWRRVSKSFKRLLDIRGDDFKKLCDLKTYKGMIASDLSTKSPKRK